MQATGADLGARGDKGALDGLVEPGGDAGLLAEGLDRVERLEAFSGMADGLGEAVLGPHRQPLHAPSDQEQRGQEHRDHDQNQQGQVRADQDHEGQGPGQGEQVAQGAGDDDAYRGLDDGHVGGEPGKHLAGAEITEVGQVETQDMAEYLLAQIGDDAFAQLIGEIEPKSRGGGQDRDPAAHDQKHAHQSRAGVQTKALVENHARAIGEREQRQGRQEKERQAQNRARPMGQHQGPKPGQGPGVAGQPRKRGRFGAGALVAHNLAYPDIGHQQIISSAARRAAPLSTIRRLAFVDNDAKALAMPQWRPSHHPSDDSLGPNILTPTPTTPDRKTRPGDFCTIGEALDFAALQATGVNLHSPRGELIEVLPYSALRERALNLAARLLGAGLEPGDRVALAAESDSEFLTAFFACQYAGLVPAPTPLPAPFGGKEVYVAHIRRMLVSAGVRAAFAPPVLAPWFAEAAEGLRLAAVGLASELPDAGAARLPDPDADGLCYLQFSSGSTRFPMGVAVTQSALMANVSAIGGPDGLGVAGQRPHGHLAAALP